jgi:hypothetical protein
MTWVLGLEYLLEGVIFTIMLYQWVQAVFALSNKETGKVEVIIKIVLIVLTIAMVGLSVGVMIKLSIFPTTKADAFANERLTSILLILLSAWLFVVGLVTLILCLIGLVKFEKAGRSSEERGAIVKSLVLFFCIVGGLFWRVRRSI